MKRTNLSKDKFKQWKEALQSGKWEAFRGFLHNEQNTLQACCLGVLNEINTGEISLRQLPSSYPENFYLSEIELKDLSVELKTKIKYLIYAARSFSMPDSLLDKYQEQIDEYRHNIQINNDKI